MIKMFQNQMCVLVAYFIKIIEFWGSHQLNGFTQSSNHWGSGRMCDLAVECMCLNGASLVAEEGAVDSIHRCTWRIRQFTASYGRHQIRFHNRGRIADLIGQPHREAVFPLFLPLNWNGLASKRPYCVLK